MISNEAVEAAVREVDRFVYKPPADELPSIEGHKNALMRAVLEAAALLSAARSQGPGEGLDEPTRWLLRYVDASGGKVSASEYRGNPIDLWCDDRGQETDTLNVAIEDGLLSCSHNSDTDESWVWITDAGRRALPAPPASQIKEG